MTNDYLNGKAFAEAVARNYGMKSALSAVNALDDVKQAARKAGAVDALLVLVCSDPRRGVSRG